ncbi:hypothetical protein K469DRAFT_208803 [Zopfia rhizophila CBS 207.26]|uniref:Uncharacterized protein n=1 Tax=Zopfia rhizophila CBS 207.26 TaxID=1314779 RepID=A0A6A6DYP6_9PEZI|nr:hypothetical protein K469DRAFT_208803 [Zopfia rhizophila CBS 207.26]
MRTWQFALLLLGLLCLFGVDAAPAKSKPKSSKAAAPAKSSKAADPPKSSKAPDPPKSSQAPASSKAPSSKVPSSKAASSKAPTSIIVTSTKAAATSKVDSKTSAVKTSAVVSSAKTSATVKVSSSAASGKSEATSASSGKVSASSSTGKPTTTSALSGSSSASVSSGKSSALTTGGSSAASGTTKSSSVSVTAITSSTSATPSACKLNARAPADDPCRTEEDNNRIMIDNYKIAEAAAKKKGKTLAVNQLYLFLMKQGERNRPKHHGVVVGKVMMVNGQRGMEATLQQLTKPTDENGQVTRHENAKVFCGAVVGAVCDTGPYKRVECAKLKKTKYKLIGDAAIEFADPDRFIQKGDAVFMREKPYNVLTWNCQIYAKNLINVTKLKDRQAIKLTDAQAQPSQPQENNSDSDDDWGYDGNNPLGGFRVVNMGPDDYNNDRISIDK